MRRVLAVTLMLFGCGGLPAERLEPVGASAQPLVACPAAGESRTAVFERFGPPERGCLYIHVKEYSWPDDRQVVEWQFAYAYVWPSSTCAGYSGQMCTWMKQDAPAVSLAQVPCELPAGGICEPYSEAP